MKCKKLAVCICFVTILMFPSVAMAVQLSVSNITGHVQSSRSGLVSQRANLRRHCSGGRVCRTCRVGHSALGRNTHSTNPMIVRVAGSRDGITHPFRAQAVVQPGRTVNSGTLLGCDRNWGDAATKDRRNPHNWFVEILSVSSGNGRASGTAVLVRQQ